jgi:radical SAM superfamily enzyme YgiQ (UPF0313 family)
MRKILFIQPKFSIAKMYQMKDGVYPLGFAYLTAYLPDHWQSEFVDEELNEINYDTDADVIGITTITLYINQAYRIAEKFRAKGKTVIMGGVHVSMCPDEALNYCDSICIGDGENVIAQMLDDFENNRLKRIYKPEPIPLDGMKFPRHDMFKNVYRFTPIATSRGCPFNCDFCAINAFYGKVYRQRDVEDIINELKSLPRKNNMIYFTDGNIYGYTPKEVERFKTLCRRIIEERKKGNMPFKYFLCFASINALADIESLDLASEAGCRNMLIGFESINPESLKDMNKTLNLNKYPPATYNQLVKNARDRKIVITAEMVFGNDADTMEILDQTEKFLDTASFDILRLYIKQPFPGTQFFKTIQKEGRLFLKNFPEDWEKTREKFIAGVHFQMKNLTEEQIQGWVKKVGMKFYTTRRILSRSARFFRVTGSLRLGLILAWVSFKGRKWYSGI